MNKICFLILIALAESLPGRRKKERENRAIVPQLLPNYTTSTLPPAHQVGCNAAWLTCRYRDGCGAALEQYMSSCDSLVTGICLGHIYCFVICQYSGNSTECDVNCRLSLIALLSTNEGERLMEVEISWYHKHQYQYIISISV